MFEKDRIFDEVHVWLTNRPDRAPPVLRGVGLGLSGGVDEIHSCPTAAKMACRPLGKTVAEVRQRYPDAPADEADLEAYLRPIVARYLSKEEVDGLSPADAAWLQISRIDNHVCRDAVPFVLRSAS